MIDTMSSRTATSQRILEKTMELAEAGEKTLSMGKIAKVAGISRQGLYLHYPSRASLLIATAQYTDEYYNLEEHLRPVQSATTAEQMIKRQAEFLGRYNPLIYPIVCATDALRRDDPELNASWHDRLANRRSGSLEFAKRLHRWQRLAEGWSIKTAGDWITGQASVKLWEELVIDLGWSRYRYVSTMHRAFQVLLRPPSEIEMLSE
jgi:AcrR family transcriptional regulator